MLRTQSTPDFSVAEHYGLRNTTCLYSKDVASGCRVKVVVCIWESLLISNYAACKRALHVHFRQWTALYILCSYTVYRYFTFPNPDCLSFFKSPICVNMSWIQKKSYIVVPKKKKQNIAFTKKVTEYKFAKLLIRVIRRKGGCSWLHLRGQSNSPNNSDKMKLKQLQCCPLSGLKYIYSEIINSWCAKQNE
jgi:hypothetical protein